MLNATELILYTLIPCMTIMIVDQQKEIEDSYLRSRKEVPQNLVIEVDMISHKIP